MSNDETAAPIHGPAGDAVPVAPLDVVLLDALPVPVVIRRASDRCAVYANPAYVALMRAGTLEQVLDRPFEEVVHPGWLAKASRDVVAVSGGGTPRDGARYRMVACDGGLIDLDIFAIPTQFGGEPAVLTLAFDASALTDAEAERDAAEENYRTLVELSPDAILVHRDGMIRYMNPSGLRMFGYARLEDVAGVEHTALIAPESREAANGRVRDLMDGRPASGPAPRMLRRRDGSVFPGEATATRIDSDGGTSIQILVRDMTEREEARRAQAAAESRAQAIIDSIPVGMHFWILDPDGELVFAGANAAAGEILGIDHEPLIGMSITEAFPMHATSGVPAVYRGVIETGTPWHDEDLYYRDGRIESSFDVYAFRIGPDQMVAAFLDSTQRARTEAELATYREGLERIVEERTVELTLANRELEQATKAKSAFLASMSHELRTPLNSIIGFSGVLLQGIAGPLSPEQERQVGMINRSGRQLLSLVGDVLDLEKIEAGRVELFVDEIDVARLAVALIDTVRPMANERGLEIGAVVDDAPGRMVGDREKIEQVLLNLLSNAIKYTLEGSVSLTVTARPDGTVAFAVSDTGIGVAREDRERIFEEFHQLPSLDVAKSPGTGLGLSIARHLAALMGGVIEMTSQPGEGSTFTLVVPEG